jgi:hypothetical protein
MDFAAIIIIVCIVVLILTEGFKNTGKWLFKMASFALALFILNLLFGDIIKHMSLAIQIAIGILIAVGILYVVLTWSNSSEY